MPRSVDDVADSGVFRTGVTAAVAIAIALALPARAPAAEPPAERHLIYLHGRIVQETQSSSPRHARFGTYELEGILDAFRSRGFVVSGAIRPKAATVSESAGRVVAEVRSLLASGVPPDRITVVGASMGAGIALEAAARLANPEIRFALLGLCPSTGFPAVTAETGSAPKGRILAIREKSDDVIGPCAPWTPGADAGLVVREIVLDTGLSHGFLYRPLPEWVNPVVEWAVSSPGKPRGK